MPRPCSGGRRACRGSRPLAPPLGREDYRSRHRTSYPWSVAFRQHVVEHLSPLCARHLREVADPVMPGLLEPPLAPGNSAGDRLKGNLVEDRVVAHLEQLRSEDVFEPLLLIGAIGRA